MHIIQLLYKAALHACVTNFLRLQNFVFFLVCLFGLAIPSTP